MGDVLKVGILTKRAQQKRAIGPINYKERLFVLTNTNLEYYEGTLKQRGKLKCLIPISNIKFVGPVDDTALNRTSAFQVAHRGYHLYICAKSEVDRSQWIEAITKACTASLCNLDNQYHASIFSSGKWQCCGSSSKNSIGCRQAESSIDNTVVLDSSDKQLIPDAKDVPPKLPPRKIESDVVALYDFVPQEPWDIALYEGEHYTVIENSKQHWWKARDCYGNEGYVPANYVQDRQMDDIEAKDWYQPTISRQEAEKCLLEDQSEGCFVVRRSTHIDGYTLSVVSKCGRVTGNAVVKHYHVKQNQTGEYYFSEKYAQPTILDLIHYHQLNAGGIITRLRHAPAKYRISAPVTHMFTDTKWDLDLADLQFTKELGKGQFGVVKLALFRGEKYVAVKMMREGTMEEDSFIEEAQVMAKLSHPNLVCLHGVVTRQRPICIVTEYMENGCLLEYIRTYASELSEQPYTMLNMCYQVCDAMYFLEENGFIHRDLAARNCLVGKEMRIKVSDFGLTRFVVDDEYTSSQGALFPIKWAAPEILNFSKYSSKSDVWAFGILMWEMFSGGKMPYAAMTNLEVVDIVAEGYRLEQPWQCPNDVYDIMRHTWESDPEHRPSFYDLMHIFYRVMGRMDNQ